MCFIIANMVKQYVSIKAKTVPLWPNSRTGTGRLGAMSMVAVRQSLISAFGAQERAFCVPIGGADVRLLGEREMLGRARFRRPGAAAISGPSRGGLATR